MVLGEKTIDIYSQIEKKEMKRAAWRMCRMVAVQSMWRSAAQTSTLTPSYCKLLDEGRPEQCYGHVLPRSSHDWLLWDRDKWRHPRIEVNFFTDTIPADLLIMHLTQQAEERP